MNILIPMAGEGIRFKDVGIDIPKPLIRVNGKTLIEHSIESLNIEGHYIFITKKYENESYNKEITKIFENLVPIFTEIQVYGKQYGTSYSALHAKDYINNDEELIITNCDQMLDWDSEDFLYLARAGGDGSVLLHESESHKHSYALIENEKITKFAEKNPISNSALVGLHYWKKGRDFVSSAERLIKDSSSSGKESYVSLTYNYLINDKKTITPYFIESNQYTSLGTPRDIEIYEAKIMEYYDKEKSKTFFIDIDGTTIKHSYHSWDKNPSKMELLPGVLEKINGWKQQGHHIVFTTARRGKNHPNLKQELMDLGLPVDQILTDVESGQRVLINDKLRDKDTDRAVAINVVTDSGFNTINWEENDL
jgi:NDP-sugar pyrophosphorylase family protein